IDAAAVGRRKLEAGALAGAAFVAIVALTLLVGVSGAPDVAEAAGGGLGLGTAAMPQEAELSLRDAPRRETTPTSVLSARAVSPILRSASHLCTELGRVTSLEDLTALLGRAADMLDASGLVVWLGTPAGTDLRPVLAHGYSDEGIG